MTRILFIGFLPLLFATTYLVTQPTPQLGELRSEIVTKLRKQAANTATRRHYSDANHFYIDEELESLPLLSAECLALQELLETEPTAPSRHLQSRLHFLQGNRLIFQESNVMRQAGLSETEEKLAHPVEVDIDDLQQILCRIEGEQPGRPQLLITDLRIGRKKSATDNETLVLDLHLLKREFEG